MKRILHRFYAGISTRDVLGGVTTAVVSLPLALTFGSVSGLGAAAGLWGAIAVGLFASIFGGTKTLISEPTGPMTVFFAAIVTQNVASDPELGVAAALTVVMLAGVFQILFGVLRLGRYITMMPYSVVSGFMSGIGILLIIQQFPSLLGVSLDAQGGVLDVLTAIPEIAAGIQTTDLIIGGGSLLLLFAVPARVRRLIPAQLLVLLVSIPAVLLIPSLANVRTIGEIPFGLPQLTVPYVPIERLWPLLIDAALLGLLGSIDSLLTSMIADSLTREFHDSNRELIGQGTGNLVSGLIGGLPGAGATMGTVVNIQVGARKPIAGVIRALVLLLFAAVLAPLLRFVPMAALSAIAVKVGVDILDWSFLGRAHRISRSATLIMTVVLLLTVLVDLIVAVGVGVFIANVLEIERLSNLPSTRVTSIDAAGDPVLLSEEEREILNKHEGNIILFHLSGPMIFGVAQAIARESAAMSRSARVLVLDLENVSVLGTTIGLALENVIRETLSNGKPVIVCAHEQSIVEKFGKLGLFADGVTLVDTRIDALRSAERLIGENASS
ncbi:MAG: SulP family inorganic anion transporter [Spirochaetales bacterium]